MTSHSLFDRISSPKSRLPILPLHSATSRSPSEYTLEELQPRPEEQPADIEPPRARLRKPAQPHTSPRRPSPSSSWDKSMESPGSPSKVRNRPIFSGPPPPIAASGFINKKTTGNLLLSPYPESSRGNQLTSAGQLGSEKSLLNQRSYENNYRPNSIWRSLQRREKVLERDIQQFLDLQASGLLAGSGDVISDKDTNRDSDDDESTFYSAATSKSRMANSLYVPPRSTADGNVIPVRQPASKKSPGLQSARIGLRRSMAALSELKAEEDSHLDTALAQRKDALAYLDKVVARKDNVYAELHALEEDDTEPLGCELRKLDAEHESLTSEIRLLEEKLVGMRNRRRWVKDRIEDVKNRRESGLSGYRAAGRDIDAEVRELLRHPPITPLDLEALKQSPGWHSGKGVELPGGADFLKLRPERRTVEMVRSWWEGEIAILERRKAQIVEDREALSEGTQIWSDVTKLVTDFESALRGLIKSTHCHKKDGDELHQVAFGAQLESMDSVVEELEGKLHLAEDKHWNLLICAVGAELEAFAAAQSVLKSTLGTTDDEPQLLDGSSRSTVRENSTQRSSHPSDDNQDESDNEVPADLLISRIEDHDHDRPPTQPNETIGSQGESENDVPPEFLAKYGSEVN